MPHPTDAERQAHVLLDLASRVTASLDLQEVLDESLAAMRELVEFGGGAIQLIEDGHLVAAATDPPMTEEAKQVRIPVGIGISGGIALTGRADYIPDLLEEPRIPAAARKAGVSKGVRAYYGVPLISGGAPIGVIQIDSPTADGFDAATRALVLAFVPTITAAVQNARMFEQEREVARRLREADKLKRDFVSIVSHELRTPLTIILGMSGTLASHAGHLGPDQIRDFATRTNGAARRLRRLIDDLLYAGNLDRGFLAVDSVPTSLTTITEALRAEHGNGQHPIVIDLAPDLPLVSSDPDRLQQVLAHLVGNAEKYSPPGTTITVTGAMQDDRVALSVRDEGPGIPENQREAIFDLFHQLADLDSRDEGGLGIGLWVVKRLCQAIGADIVVTDAPAGGTSFTLHLPAAADAGTPPVAQQVEAVDR